MVGNPARGRILLSVHFIKTQKYTLLAVKKKKNEQRTPGVSRGVLITGDDGIAVGS